MFHRLAQIGCVMSTVVLLSACGDRSPTAPSTLNSARGESAATVGAIPSTGVSTQGLTTQSGPAPTQSATNYEIKFMENMIDHHAMAVAMGQICLQKAIHEELRSLCQSIITSQSAQIAEMRRLEGCATAIVRTLHHGLDVCQLTEVIRESTGRTLAVRFATHCLTDTQGGPRRLPELAAVSFWTDVKLGLGLIDQLLAAPLVAAEATG